MRQKTVWILAGAAAAVLALTGIFGMAKRESRGADRQSVRIGVALYKSEDTFISSIRSALEENAKTYQQETGVKVKLDIVDAQDDQNTQNAQVERFISLGCDVLCVNIVDRSSAASIIDQAMAADVPVVFFNREPVEDDLNRWEKLYYVGADARESAVLEGRIVAEAYRRNPELVDLNGDGTVGYVILEGETGHQDALVRTEWSVRTLKESGLSIEKVAGGIANWERSQASAMMEQWLSDYGDRIELALCNNDDMALGALDALERAGVSSINVVGIDGTPQGLQAVESGKMLGTVVNDYRVQGETIFRLAVSLARSGQPEASLFPEAPGDMKYIRIRQYSKIKENQ